MQKNQQKRKISSKIITQPEEFVDQTKKHRNIPAQIWAKRNLLKKLAIQTKFSKTSTNQYAQIVKGLDDSQSCKNNQILTAKRRSNAISPDIIRPAQKCGMRKLSNAKAQNTLRYTENYFASNIFSANGSKAYQYKSTASQGHNFISVRMAIISQKKVIQNYKKCDSSTGQLNSDGKLEQQKICISICHKRSFSQQQNCIESQQLKSSKIKNFFKVSTKQIHPNKDQNCMELTPRQKSSFLFKRTKTDWQASMAEQIIKLKIEKGQNMTKNRPKSCAPRKKSNIIDYKISNEAEFTNQGWKTKYGQAEEEAFSFFFRQ